MTHLNKMSRMSVIFKIDGATSTHLVGRRSSLEHVQIEVVVPQHPNALFDAEVVEGVGHLQA